jgi:hypothetical protein
VNFLRVHYESEDWTEKSQAEANEFPNSGKKPEMSLSNLVVSNFTFRRGDGHAGEAWGMLEGG